MPAGAVPVPINAVMGKREECGYEFIYQGWKQGNPTRENCRIGATREDLFPTDRDIKLDVTFLKKMGLSKQRMQECNSLFFYQLILLGGALIKSPKIFIVLLVFFHLGSLGIYVNKMNPNFQKKN
jgi:hypothetical protein